MPLRPDSVNAESPLKRSSQVDRALAGLRRLGVAYRADLHNPALWWSLCPVCSGPFAVHGTRTGAWLDCRDGCPPRWIHNALEGALRQSPNSRGGRP